MLALIAAAAAMGMSRAAVAPPRTSLADAVAAEEALGEGRVRLAETVARRARARAGSRDDILVARLLRVEIAAAVESDDTGATPRLREELRASEPRRPASVERALDAVLDMHVAMHHERRGGPSAMAEASRVVELTAALDDAAVAPLAPGMCRAGAYVARHGSEAGVRAVARGTRLASARAVDTAKCLVAAGDLARGDKQLDAAAGHYDAALAVLGSRAALRERREIWFSKARLAEERGDAREAFACAKKAAFAVDELLARETDLDAREALLTGTLGYYGSAERLGLDAGDDAEAIAIAEHGKGRALAAVLAGTSTLAATMESHALRAPTAALGFEGAAALRRLATTLRNDEAAVAYTLLPADRDGKLFVAIGVVTPEAISAVRVPRPPSLTSDVRELRRAVERNDGDAATSLGKKLHAVLLAPVESRLRGKTRLLVSPHLSLHGLPWAALHDGERPVIAARAVARVPPLVLPRPEPRRASDAPARWVSVFDAARDGVLPLPALAALGDRVDAAVTPVVALRGREATADRLAAALESADALVFGGHAHYEPRDPLRSALLLAASDLRADRVITLARPLEAVVLVGCETGRQWDERPSYGDETIGLPRAFLAAGARSVVGSLWPIVDRDAEDFVHAVSFDDVVRDAPGAIARAQACLAEGRCAARGVVTWASFVVDAR